MWTEEDVRLVPVKWLKPHEEIKIKPRDKLLDMTNRWGGFTKPILVDTHTGALLDGHHRLSVAKELGLKLIPAICLDYLNSELISLELWPNANIESVDKADVIEMCLGDELYPPKTTKHVVIYDLPPILVALEELA
jgi:ParB-like chromosome segregation protein Spo0J